MMLHITYWQQNLWDPGTNNSKGRKACKCAAHALNTGEEEYKRIASFFQKMFVALVKGNAALFNHHILVTTVYMKAAIMIYSGDPDYRRFVYCLCTLAISPTRNVD